MYINVIFKYIYITMKCSSLHFISRGRASPQNGDHTQVVRNWSLNGQTVLIGVMPLALPTSDGTVSQGVNIFVSRFPSLK